MSELEPENAAELLAYEEAFETPQWPRFRGNNHELLDDPGVRRFGGVSFKRHLGKPLTRELWVDLVSRLRVRRIRVYRPQDCEWSDAINRAAKVLVDNDGNVTDVTYYP